MVGVFLHLSVTVKVIRGSGGISSSDLYELSSVKDPACQSITQSINMVSLFHAARKSRCETVLFSLHS